MKKILVVEDDPLNAQILCDFLQANGYVVTVAGTGPEGTRLFEHDRPDLMLVDVQLPHKNGFEVCREVRGLPGGGEIRLLVMSAVYTDDVDGDPDAHSSNHVRIDGYLAKPFDLSNLLERVRALIGASSPSST